MPEEQTPEPTKSKLNLKLSLDYKIISIVLLAVILLMLALWRPWAASGVSDRTINVTGKATLKAEPDEYVFNPSYQFSNTNKELALEQLTKKTEEVAAKLKELGVPENKIKTTANAYDYPVAYSEKRDGEYGYSSIITITVSNKELAQKVQDYLITTGPIGSVTPYPGFSDVKQKELEDQARDQATKDARAKADQSAKNLGFRVGKVKEVSDGEGFDGVIPLGRESLAAGAEDTASKLELYPGENELTYSVTVVYYVR